MKQLLEHLWLTYKHYGELSVNRKVVDNFDSSKYASECVKNFLEYQKSCQEVYGWNDMETIISNEIRIYKGLIECYDSRDFKKRPTVSNKTRWCL
jgi:hypothetical protein